MIRFAKASARQAKQNLKKRIVIPAQAGIQRIDEILLCLYFSQ